MTKRPLEECATQIQALVRGFLCRKDNFVIQLTPRRYSSYVSALTLEGFSTRSLMSYQDDDLEEHPGFETDRQEDEFCSPIRKPRRIASKEDSSFHMLTVEEDDEHPGFDSPYEQPVRPPSRLLSRESVDSRTFMDEGDFLFSPKTVDAACAPKKRSIKLNMQEMPFARGQRALAGRQRPKDKPVVLPIRQRSDASAEL